MKEQHSISTRCVHAGTRSDDEWGGINTPLHVSTAHRYLDRDGLYPRYFNVPNQLAAAEKVASLENGEDAIILSSGMAAISSVFFSLLRSGDHVVVQKELYGGTHHFLEQELPKQGIQVTYWDAQAPDDLEGLLEENTRMIYAETPSNPLLNVVDLEYVERVAKENNLYSVVDNTFATPIGQNPLAFGIDLVVHSGTKFFGGHSDLICGAVVGDEKLLERIEGTAVNFGGCPDPRTCHLLERSLKTLNLRMKEQSANAQRIAERLESLSNVRKVHYPGLPSHKGFEKAREQMNMPGAMLSFELDEKAVDPESFQKSLNLITPALSLGGVESSICSPARTSHAKLSEEEREKAGIRESLLRLSVGIEDAQDLIEDIEQGLGR